MPDGASSIGTLGIRNGDSLVVREGQSPAAIVEAAWGAPQPAGGDAPGNSGSFGDMVSGSSCCFAMLPCTDPCCPDIDVSPMLIIWATSKHGRLNSCWGREWGWGEGASLLQIWQTSHSKELWINVTLVGKAGKNVGVELQDEDEQLARALAASMQGVEPGSQPPFPVNDAHRATGRHNGTSHPRPSSSQPSPKPAAPAGG